MVNSQVRRYLVALAMERRHSQRQACELMELPRSMSRYRSIRVERDAPALDAMRRIAATYPRGSPDESATRLSALVRGGIATATAATATPGGNVTAASTAGNGSENQLWAYDFVHDACANGQKLKCLTLIDEFTRECLAIDVAGRELARENETGV